MDLKEFIKTALVDIVQGIDEARSELDNKANYICPIFSPLGGVRKNHHKC